MTVGQNSYNQYDFNKYNYDLNNYNYNATSYENYKNMNEVNHKYEYNYKSVEKYLKNLNQPKNTNIFSRKPNYNTRFIAGKLTSDLTYTILGSEKAPIYDVDYVKNTTKQYVKGISRREAMKLVPKIFTNKAKSALGVYDYSSCVVSEVNYLKNHNIYFADNIPEVRNKCMINTGYRLIRSELSLLQYMGFNIANTTIDEVLTNSYYQQPQNHNYLAQKSLDFDFYSFEKLEYPLFESIASSFEPISKEIDYYVDKGY